MASSVMLKSLICMALMGMVLLVPQGESAISCSSAYNTLYPCVNYVIGSAPLQPDCCTGVKSLNNQAKSTPDRQSVCSCLKSLASNAGSGRNLGKAQGLPKKCGVNLPYSIDPNIDCSKVR